MNRVAQQGGLFDEAAAGGLTVWPPDLSGLDPAWRSLVQDFMSSEPGQVLSARLSQALQAGAVVYPPDPFRAMALTPLKVVRVVILGQDP